MKISLLFLVVFATLYCSSGIISIIYKYYNVMAFIYLVAQWLPREEEIIAALQPDELQANRGYYIQESHCLCNNIIDHGSSRGIWYKLQTCTCYGY